MEVFFIPPDSVFFVNECLQHACVERRIKYCLQHHIYQNFELRGAERGHCFFVRQWLSIAAMADEKVGAEDSAVVVDGNMAYSTSRRAMTYK